MDCREAESLIDTYLDRELDQARTAALEAHVRACPECRESLGRLIEFLRSDDTVAAPEGLSDRIVRTVERRMAGRSRRWMKLTAAGMAVAAAAALWVVGWWELGQSHAPGRESQPPVVQVSPWMASGMVQAVATQAGPAGPVISAAQAHLLERSAQEPLERLGRALADRALVRTGETARARQPLPEEARLAVLTSLYGVWR